MPSEEELALRGCVATVSTLHVGVYSAHGDVKVEVKRQDDPSQEHDENSKGSVLEIRELYFHAPKLSAPT